MTIQIPTWAIQATLAFFPFLFVALAAKWADRHTGIYDMVTPLVALGSSAIVASICWTALIVWSFLR